MVLKHHTPRFERLNQQPRRTGVREIYLKAFEIVKASDPWGNDELIQP